MDHWHVILLLGMLLAAPNLLLSAESQDVKSSHQLFIAAEDMVKNIKVTSYQHSTDIDEGGGRFNCDCSGFIGYALRKTFPETYLATTGDLAPWKSRPLAATFFETFERVGEAGDGLWKMIPRLTDAQPGDILSWRKPVLEEGKTTGHVLLIASHPIIEADGRYRVRVFDSTSVLHEEDSRPQGTSGVGVGDMWFEVNETGMVKAFFVRKESKRVSSNPVLIGRILSGEDAEIITNSKDGALIGKSESVAEKAAIQNGFKWRVILRDNNAIPISLSRYNEKRLNAVVRNGKVIRIRRG